MDWTNGRLYRFCTEGQNTGIIIPDIVIQQSDVVRDLIECIPMMGLDERDIPLPKWSNDTVQTVMDLSVHSDLPILYPELLPDAVSLADFLNLKALVYHLMLLCIIHGKEVTALEIPGIFKSLKGHHIPLAREIIKQGVEAQSIANKYRTVHDIAYELLRKYHNDGSVSYQYGDVQYRTSIDYESSCEWRMWTLRGEYHRDDDLPAMECWSRERRGGNYLSYETWYSHGVCTRGNDKPAHIMYRHSIYHEPDIDPEDSLVIVTIESQRWVVNGKCHRDGDLPARVEYFETCGTSREEWYQNGDRHRDGDRPARIIYTQHGILSKEWYTHDKLHRDGDLPAKVTYTYLGKPDKEEWYQNGDSHRDGDSPAKITYRYDGKIHSVEWYRHGKLYREDGPAVLRPEWKPEWDHVDEWE